jgi:hypothetical protein
VAFLVRFAQARRPHWERSNPPPKPPAREVSSMYKGDIGGAGNSATTAPIRLRIGAGRLLQPGFIAATENARRNKA